MGLSRKNIDPAISHPLLVLIVCKALTVWSLHVQSFFIYSFQEEIAYNYLVILAASYTMIKCSRSRHFGSFEKFEDGIFAVNKVVDE